MSDDFSIDVDIRSNVDQLNALAFDQQVRRIVRTTSAHGEQFLRAVVPVGETGALRRHVGRSGPHELGDTIWAEVGVEPIMEEARSVPQIPGLQNPADRPIFVDRGTGVHGPLRSPFFGRSSPRELMKFIGPEGFPIFRHSVSGQRGQHFMAATNAEMMLDVQMSLDELRARTVTPGGLVT